MSACQYGAMSATALVFGVAWFVVGNDRAAVVNLLAAIAFALWEITEHIKRGAR